MMMVVIMKTTKLKNSTEKSKKNILTSLLHIGTIRKDVVMDAEIFPTAVPKIFEQLTKSLAAKMQT